MSRVPRISAPARQRQHRRRLLGRLSVALVLSTAALLGLATLGASARLHSSNGTGNNTINYSVAANTGAARTGTITVADHVFHVGQNAAPATLQVGMATPGLSEGQGFATITRQTGIRKSLQPAVKRRLRGHSLADGRRERAANHRG